MLEWRIDLLILLLRGHGAADGVYWPFIFIFITTFSTTNGPTCYPSKTPTLQHLLQPPTCGKNSRWQACLPPSQKARFGTQMWRLWNRSSWNTGTPPPQICNYLQTPKDCTTCIWWFKMWWLRQVTVWISVRYRLLPASSLSSVFCGHS